jgi:hypothetical protein
MFGEAWPRSFNQAGGCGSRLAPLEKRADMRQIGADHQQQLGAGELHQGERQPKLGTVEHRQRDRRSAGRWNACSSIWMARSFSPFPEHRASRRPHDSSGAECALQC